MVITGVLSLFLSLVTVFVWYFFQGNEIASISSASDCDCPDYTEYSKQKHQPFSQGPLQLPFQRPPEECRKFRSKVIDDYIHSLQNVITDKDLYRIFENCMPNTLDTAILWFNEDEENPRTFISTGDIHAEWLRDSSRQLSIYMPFLDKDPSLKLMVKGAIYQQAEFVKESPYCNAFHPPLKSGLTKRKSSFDDAVTPEPNWDKVFECKWELDSVSSFLELTNDYLDNTNNDTSILKGPWLDAFGTLLDVLENQSKPTFDPVTGELLPFTYTFRRNTNIGTETLPLDGSGNPVNNGTGLIRSAFRPSDDSNILQLFIPANAQLYLQLKRIEPHIVNESFKSRIIQLSDGIENGLKHHSIVKHSVFGEVYAYEIDGFGGHILMDDANLPSLLSLPDMQFLPIDDEVYQNTRKMILSKSGNPYYLTGEFISGIGGPHVGLSKVWHMSLLVQIRTSNDDDEISRLLTVLKTTTAGLGLMHEGVNVNSENGEVYSRPWFSWANSEFGKTIIDLVKRKPHLLS